MPKYILVIVFFLSTTGINAVHSKPRKPCARERKYDILYEMNPYWQDLDEHHKYLCPLIRRFNKAITFCQREFDPFSLTLMSHPFSEKPFVKQLIKDSVDIETKYPNLQGQALLQKMMSDLDDAIERIPHPGYYKKAIGKAREVKRLVAQERGLKNIFYPEITTHKEARNQKIALFEFVQNTLLEPQMFSNSKKTREKLFFAKIYNLATLYSIEGNIKEELAALETPSISFTQARQYIANHQSFYKKFITNISRIQTKELCDKAEDAIMALKDSSLVQELDKQVMDFLAIPVQGQDHIY